MGRQHGLCSNVCYGQRFYLLVCYIFAQISCQLNGCVGSRSPAINVFISAFEADQRGDFMQAALLYKEVLTKHPNCDEAHWNLALGYAREGRVVEAAHHYEEVIRIHSDSAIRRNPDNLSKLLKPDNVVTAMVNLGHLQLAQGLQEDAQKTWRRILERDPDNQVAKNLLLQDVEKEAQYRTFPARPKFPSVQAVTLEQLETSSELMRGSRPFVLVGATQAWPAHKKWAKLRYFRDIVPGDDVVDYYPFNLDRASHKPFLVPWAKLLQSEGKNFRMRTPSELGIKNGGLGLNAAYAGAPYIQWRLSRKVWDSLAQDIYPEVTFLRSDPRVQDSSAGGQSWMTTFIDDGQGLSSAHLDNWWDQTRWRMLLIGQINSTMFLHQDDIETATWQAQVIEPCFLSFEVYGLTAVPAIRVDYWSQTMADLLT